MLVWHGMVWSWSWSGLIWSWTWFVLVIVGLPEKQFWPFMVLVLYVMIGTPSDLLVKAREEIMIHDEFFLDSFGWLKL